MPDREVAGNYLGLSMLSGLCRWLSGTFRASRRRLAPPTAGALPRGYFVRIAIDALESRQLLSATYFVATTGSDQGLGTIDSPFQTIQYAASVANPGDTVDIRGGIYRETVTPPHSGAPGAPITFQAYNGENVIIDGADPITGWTNSSGSIYQATDPTDLGFGNNQVYVNGQAINQASWPNLGLNLSHPNLEAVPAGGSSLTDNAILSSGINWTGGVIHIIAGQSWVSQTASITGQSGGTLFFRLGANVDPHGGIKAGNKYYLTGKLAALNSPGQWFLGSGNTLSLWTPDGSDPNTDTVEVKHRLWGFNLSGKNNISIQGINLFACSIVANGTNHIQISGITAQYVSQFILASNGWQPGNSNGIVLNGYSNSISNSVVAYSAGNGILVLGSNNTVQNNIIHDCDYTATDTAGIFAWGSGDLITQNTVYNCGRDGIKFSSTTNTQVTYNLVHDVMLQTTDGGGIYTYGTNGAGSQIAYNTCYNIHSGGWGAAGLYLDNKSSNYSVHNNHVYNVDIALKMNPTSFGEKIVNNTLLADLQSVGSSGTENMSGSQFVGNVFNSKTMIKGSVLMSGNVTSGDTAGSFISGASIPSVIPAVASPAFHATAAAISAAAQTSAPQPAAALAPPTPVVLTPVEQLQADLTKLAADRAALTNTMAADKSSAGALLAADRASIAADKSKAHADRHNPAARAADFTQLAADRLKFHSDTLAGRAAAAKDKATLTSLIKADETHLKSDKHASKH